MPTDPDVDAEAWSLMSDAERQQVAVMLERMQSNAVHAAATEARPLVKLRKPERAPASTRLGPHFAMLLAVLGWMRGVVEFPGVPAYGSGPGAS